MQARLGIRVAAIALASLAYVLGCHWLMTRVDASPWNVVGVIAPMLAAISIGAWRAGQRVVGAIAALLLAGLCGQALMGVQMSPQTLYLAQHAGINLFLALGFGSTLRAGRTSLITAMAARVHRSLTADMAAYTRKLTAVWTVFFVSMAVASIALYSFASFDAWALFANLLSPLAVAAMFGIEHVVRYRLHPEFERASIADSIRSYVHKTQASVPPVQRDTVA